jgi:nitroimidazol reductase NimA-like FMN-containing flavoprotein (pyridoxamine 5'-phosphate oxidase superfamily)
MIEMTLQQIVELLNESAIGRLAMAGNDRRPYVIPLPFCWLEGGVYLRLPISGRKGAVLTENDAVCFEVDCFEADLSTYASVLIEGRLVEVQDLDEKCRVRAASDEKYNRLRNGNRPGHGRATPLKNLPLRKIQIERLSGRKNGFRDKTGDADGVIAADACTKSV